ncbi:MAG TPA: hypothetical protein V6C65_26265 [Allocoleopsis sp.]
MKKFLILAMFLVGCGNDVDVTCPEAGCAPINVPTVESTPTPTPTPKPVPKVETTPAPVPTVEVENTPAPEPEDHKVEFVFKYSHRETVTYVQGVCDEPLESFLQESVDDWREWTCNDVRVSENPKMWKIKNYTVDDISRNITKTAFEDYKSNPECKVTAAKSIKCTFTENYIEVYADTVFNLDEPCYSGYCNYGGKIYEKQTWKVYYWPEL